MATHSSILAWRIPMDRGASRATVLEAAKSWTRLSDLSTALTLIFVSLIMVCLSVFCLWFILPETLLPELGWIFPFPCLGSFQLLSLQILSQVLFLSHLFWDPYSANVGVFNVVPEVSQAVFISFHSFFLFSSAAVISRKTDSSLTGHKQILVYIKTQRKGVTPPPPYTHTQETEPKLPASVGGLPVEEVWIGRGSPQEWGTSLEGPPWRLPSTRGLGLLRPKKYQGGSPTPLISR